MLHLCVRWRTYNSNRRNPISDFDRVRDVRDPAVRFQPLLVGKGIGHDDHLGGSRLTTSFSSRPSRSHPIPQSPRPACSPRRPLPFLPKRLHRIHRRQQLHRLVADQPQKSLLRRGKQAARRRIGLRRDHLHATIMIGAGKHSLGRNCSWYSAAAAYRYCGAKCAAKAKGKPQLRRQLRAEQAGPQQRDGHIAALPRNRLHHLSRLRGPQDRSEALPAVRGNRRRSGASPGAARASSRSRRPGARPRPRSIRPGIDRLQRPKLFRHHQRRVIGQHDSAAAHANRLGRSGHMADEHRRRRTRQPVIE